VTNTIEISRRLRELKFPPDQSDGVAELVVELIEKSAATTADLSKVESNLKADFVAMGNRFDQLKWVNITALGLFASAAIKYLFN